MVTQQQTQRNQRRRRADKEKRQRTRGGQEDEDQQQVSRGAGDSISHHVGISLILWFLSEVLQMSCSSSPSLCCCHLFLHQAVTLLMTGQWPVFGATGRSFTEKCFYWTTGSWHWRSNRASRWVRLPVGRFLSPLSKTVTTLWPPSNLCALRGDLLWKIINKNFLLWTLILVAVKNRKPESGVCIFSPGSTASSHSAKKCI